MQQPLLDASPLIGVPISSNDWVDHDYLSTMKAFTVCVGWGVTHAM